MAKEIESTLTRFAMAVREAAGDRLRAVVLYGSAASGQHVRGRSDLNMLVVADRIDAALLSSLQKRMSGWGRERIAAPLVVDPAFLSSSLDSYPLEILGMMAAYRVLAGEDPFGGLVVKAEHVRLQTEREAKAKELLLRRGFLESRGKDRALIEILAGAVPALEAILRGMLFLRGQDWKLAGTEFRETCGRALGIDPAIPDALRRLRVTRRRLSRREVLALYDRTLGLLAAIQPMLEG